MVLPVLICVPPQIQKHREHRKYPHISICNFPDSLFDAVAVDEGHSVCKFIVDVSTILLLGGNFDGVSANMEIHIISISYTECHHCWMNTGNDIPDISGSLINNRVRNAYCPNVVHVHLVLHYRWRMPNRYFPSPSEYCAQTSGRIDNNVKWKHDCFTFIDASIANRFISCFSW